MGRSHNGLTAAAHCFARLVFGQFRFVAELYAAPLRARLRARINIITTYSELVEENSVPTSILLQTIFNA